MLVALAFLGGIGAAVVLALILLNAIEEPKQADLTPIEPRPPW
jgi:hypothetical protein